MTTNDCLLLLDKIFQFVALMTIIELRLESVVSGSGWLACYGSICHPAERQQQANNIPHNDPGSFFGIRKMTAGSWQHAGSTFKSIQLVLCGADGLWMVVFPLVEVLIGTGARNAVEKASPL